MFETQTISIVWEWEVYSIYLTIVLLFDTQVVYIIFHYYKYIAAQNVHIPKPNFNLHCSQAKLCKLKNEKLQFFVNE